MSKPIRILHISETTTAGVRKHILSLARSIDKNLFEIEIASPVDRLGDYQEIGFGQATAQLGIRHHPVQMQREINPVADLTAITHLSNIIRKGQFEIVHTHSSKAGILGRIAAKRNRVKTIHTPNGFYFLGQNFPKQQVYLLIEQLAGLLTDQLIVVSNGERETAASRKVIAPPKIIQIPNGIDIAAFQQDSAEREHSRTKLGLNHNFVIGTIARFTSQKDPFNFVRAAQLVLQQHPTARFIWCGEGELQTATETLARQLNIHAAFHFLGFRQEIKKVMAAFDIFALGSLFEGLPYTLLEAMALELPIVATNVVGNNDLIHAGQTGLLVAPQAPEEMAAAISKLITSPQLRQKLSANAKQLVHTNYDMQQMINDLQKTYQLLATSSKKFKSSTEYAQS